MTTHAEGESLYIHWPFDAPDDEAMKLYHAAVVEEIQQWASGFPQKKSIRTVFFGGSVPSTYPNDLLLDMAGILKDTFEFDAQREVTLEVHPMTMAPEKINTWREAGINRLSIDASCIRGSMQDVIACVHAVAGLLSVISVDLTGSPDNNNVEWKERVMAVVLLPIHHISISFDTSFDLYQWTVDALAVAGFEQYETMNFARPGYRAQHSQVYWQRKPYKGFGAGACSFDGSTRSKNASDREKYLEQAGGVSELLGRQQEWVELLMLSLPQQQGISWEVVKEYLPKNLMEQFKQDIQLLADAGYMAYTRDGFALTAHGRSLADEIVIKLAYDIQ